MNWFKRTFNLTGKHNEVPFEKSTTSIVVFGVENAKWAGKCTGSLLDCDTITSIFKKAANDFDIKVFKDKDATAANFTKAVSDAVTKPLAIIYYSGHGGSDTKHSLGGDYKSEADGINEYLCLYDKPLLDDKVWELISKSKGRVVCIWDCCHSATMFRTAPIDGKTEEFELDGFAFENSELKSNKNDSFSLFSMSGCPDSDYSYGSSTGGVFTNAIKRRFEYGDSYATLWDNLVRDKTLKNSEIIQKFEIGKSFKDNLFCQ